MLLAAVAVFAAWDKRACAELIVPSNATASSALNSGGIILSASNLINNTGLSSPPYNQSSSHDANYWNMWLSPAAGASGEWVTFDLGANYDLTNAFVWNYNQPGGTAGGVQTFDIYVSTNIVGAYSRVGSTSFTLNQAGGGAEPCQTITFTASRVRRIKFLVQSSYGAYGPGLSEVKFGGTLSANRSGDRMISPTAAAASSQGHSQMPAANLINGSGLLPYTDRHLVADSTHGNTYSDMWLSLNEVSTAWVVFDLGTNYTLSGAVIWNYNQAIALTRGVQTFDLYVSGVGTNGPFSLVAGSPFSLADGGGTTKEPSQSIPLAATKVRAVKLVVRSNYGLTDVGLSEVRFAGYPSPPPPSGTLIHIY
jgi:hypothetical protein